MTFTATPAPMPEDLSLKARLAWTYFFSGCWAVVHTAEGMYIVTDEACELENAAVYHDEEAFVTWLEATADDHLRDDSVDFLRFFVSVPDLINEDVASEMIRLINS